MPDHQPKLCPECGRPLTADGTCEEHGAVAVADERETQGEQGNGRRAGRRRQRERQPAGAVSSRTRDGAGEGSGEQEDEERQERGRGRGQEDEEHGESERDRERGPRAQGDDEESARGRREDEPPAGGESGEEGDGQDEHGQQDAERERHLHAFHAPADVLVADDEVAVYVDLPGLTPDQVEVDLDGDVLTIRGERTLPYEPRDDGGPTQRHERGFGHFERVLYVPRGLDPDRVDAALADGVLTLRIPRTEPAGPHRIRIGRPDGEEGR